VFYDIDGNEMKNTYEDKEGNEKPAYFRYYVNYKHDSNMELSFSLFLGNGDLSASKFASLCKALFGDNGKGEANCQYSAVEHFIGDTLIAQVTNSEGSGKFEGKTFANIDSLSQDPDFKPKTIEDIKEIKISSIEEEKKKAAEFRKNIEDSNDDDFEKIPF